jgi:uncharacterized protein (TIGR02453 family)
MKKSLSFLKKISKNNNTEWMHAHKDEYLEAKSEFDTLVQELIARISSWDSRLPYLEPKNCTFRLNRDIRFSDNKKPYKENFGAFMGYGGKKGGLPGYYFHLSPKEIFVAGGIWMPEAPELLKIRRYISENGDEFEKILANKAFNKTFGQLENENALKRPPKGFYAENPYIEFLKLKSFIVSKPISAKDAVKPGLGKIIEKDFKIIKSLNDFLFTGLDGLAKF